MAMGIFDDVSTQIKNAMKAKDKPRTNALRNIRAAFIVGMKENNASTLSDEHCVGLLRKLAKQRLESIEAFRKGNRPESAAEEEAELAVIEAYLPKLADEPTTRAWVAQAIADAGATTPQEVGKVMGRLMGAHKGDVDGKLARTIASELLQLS